MSCLVALPRRAKPSTAMFSAARPEGPRQHEGRRLRRRVIFGQGERLGLGVEQQAVAVHGDAVVGSQDQHVPGLGGGFGHRGRADIFEHLGDGGHRPLRQFAEALPAGQHFLAAAPAGDQADADLDEADIGLGMGLDRRRECSRISQPPPSAMPAGRRHHRERARISAPCMRTGPRRRGPRSRSSRRCWRRTGRGRDWRRRRNSCPRCRSRAPCSLP